ncbi:peptide ABC transporter substrate-binding protein [Lichenicola sp.]|uniref:peptide ABC transporter substrate-binding protein n=1 Tax=Lichenicola sp. TaxID=2804529 RepID=UPI003B002854
MAACFFLTRLAIALSACLGLGGMACGPTRAAGGATCGTVIVPTAVGSGGSATLTSFNPMLTDALGAHQVIEQILRPLVWIDRHGKPDPERGLAQSVTTPDDGLTFVITLHDWKWSDGVPITSDDLVFTFDLMHRLGTGYVYYGTGGMPTLVAGVTRLSDHQVQLRMVRKVNPDWFISLGLGNVLFPLPKHKFDGLSLVELRRRQTDTSLFSVSSGPFLLQDYQVGRHIVMVPNPLYGGHHPQIRRLVLAFPNGTTALEQLRSDNLDIANVPYLLAGLMGRLPGFDIVTLHPGFGYGDGYFNFHSHNAPFLADDAVRRAITRGIDQKQIIDLVFHGQAVVDHAPVPASMTDMQSDRGRAGYPELSFDPAAARAGLLADGWKPGADGIMARDGHRLAFTILTSAEGATNALQAEVIQRNLRVVGMEVSIQLVGFNQLLATLDGNGHDWDLAVLLWSVATYPDVHDFFSSDGTENFGHYLDPHMDQLNRDVMFGSGDGPLHAVEDYTADQAPHLYLPYPTPNVLVRPGLGGITDFLSPNGMWSAELLTLSGPLACPPGQPLASGGADAPHA